MNAMSDNHIWLFDTTLRDGGQTRGVDFSVSDKIAICQALDDFGIDYVEAGWPGANPTDDQFFEKPPILKKSSLVAFGMTRRGGRSTENVPGFNAIINAQTDVNSCKKLLRKRLLLHSWKAHPWIQKKCTA